MVLTRKSKQGSCLTCITVTGECDTAAVLVGVGTALWKIDGAESFHWLQATEVHVKQLQATLFTFSF